MSARLVFELENETIDVKAPCIEPIVGYMNKFVRGWAVNYLIDRMSAVPMYHFVDVGACIGGWGMVMARRYPESFVTCIEPYPENFKCLAYNIRPYKNMRAFRVAADEKPGKIMLSLPDTSKMVNETPIELWNNFGLVTAYGEPDKKAVEAKTFRLDDIVENVGILKLDVEGMEMRVLAGAQRILTEDRPLIQIELLQRNQERAGHTVDEVDKYLESFDYLPVMYVEADGIYVAKEKK